MRGRQLITAALLSAVFVSAPAADGDVIVACGGAALLTERVQPHLGGYLVYFTDQNGLSSGKSFYSSKEAWEAEADEIRKESARSYREWMRFLKKANPHHANVVQGC